MFQVNLNGNDYRVYFAHFEPTMAELKRIVNDVYTEEKVNQFPFDRVEMISKCTIENLESGEQIFGFTFKSVDDQFCYRRGRKESLTKALERGGFIREERMTFWDEYLEVGNILNNNNEKVFVVVENGIVLEVYTSNKNIDVQVLDFDNENGSASSSIFQEEELTPLEKKLKVIENNYNLVW